MTGIYPPPEVVLYAACMVALLVAGVLGIVVDRRIDRSRPLARQWLGIGITVCFTLASMAAGALLVSAT